MSTGTSQRRGLGKLPLPPLLPLPLAPLQQEPCMLQGFRSLLLHLRLYLLALRRLLLRLLFLLLLPSGRQRSSREEPERGGVYTLSRRCCQQRRGHRRLSRSSVRQDCVQQLRLGILQDSRPRPRVATVFCSRRTTCDTSTTLRRVVECSGNCSGDADLLVSPPRAHPPLPPPHGGSRVAFNMACHVDRFRFNRGSRKQKATPELNA